VEVLVPQQKSIMPELLLRDLTAEAVVQEPALVDALSSGHLSFAALDVLGKQPPEVDNPLLRLGNVLLTPHTAGITAQAVRKMSRIAADEALRILIWDRPANLVNANAWERIAARWRHLS
jgi:D-3-phosphoglycerate dehydrogenase / 2-oxoglutarate reductase